MLLYITNQQKKNVMVGFNNTIQSNINKLFYKSNNKNIKMFLKELVN